MHGLVLVHECDLLVTFLYPRYEEIPVDALGAIRNTGIHALISPKCGTSSITPGPEFESGDSEVDPSEAPGSFTKIPMKDRKYKI
jgi:hypothetical protein